MQTARHTHAFQPVSYTHLDVYKRQHLLVRVPAGEDLAKACAGFDAHLDMLAAALEGVSIKFPFDVFVQARKVYAAVSYTHLDVYKRQALLGK